MTAVPPDFDAHFRDKLRQLFVWRRDVRHFLTDPLPDGVLENLIEIANLAPSVGLSQPWRFVSVETPAHRDTVVQSFEQANADALQGYEGERAHLYSRLKLSGLRDAPVHLAVFCVSDPEQGHGLGRQTMPETLAYSTVGAIQYLWLAARAEGIGLGWVSILDPEKIRETLDLPDDWQLVGYLCLGYPEGESDHPELEDKGWEERRASGEFLIRR